LIIKIFTKYFTKININTLDRAVDAGLFTIYLILVPHTTGPFLSEIIDKLTVQKHKEQNAKGNKITVHYETTKEGDSTRSFDYKKIEDIKEKYDVSLLLDSHTPKYDFKEYSNSTRIGILYNEASFSTFVDDFNKDVERVFRKEYKNFEKWEKISFIILRISPSKYSFGLMNDKIENMDGVKFSSNLNLANEIAKLASPYLSEQQKMFVTTFENDINLEKIFEELAFFDFMSLNMQKTYKNYDEFLKKPDLIKKIKECLKSYDIESFRQLSTRIYHHPEKENKLKISLSSIIAEVYNKDHTRQLNTDIQEIFISEFLDSIKSLYDMWNHDMWNK
jgi:hypothetical protein